MEHKMPRVWIAAVAVPMFHFALSGTAFADEAAEKYVDDALPVMYHSCASVVEEAAGDNAYIEKVINSLLAVSLYNRDVTTAMFDVSDDAKTAMHDKFVAALKKGCAADKNALLAGVVDQAVTEALAK
ncbi:MAG: hypothetical protein AB7F74_08590 [Parvibaculaceae bacterium]